MYSVSSPVLLILFNRFDQTKALIESLKQVSLTKLYIGIDGPRNESDKEEISKIVKYIKYEVANNCEVFFNLQEQNLGCGLGPRAAISWFFTMEEEGIILEDDCIPNSTFFKYCDDLLTKYKNENNVWIISGDNGGPILRDQYFLDYDYTFSRVPLIWGWATWKDRWLNYDDNLENWKSSVLKNWKKLDHVKFFEKFVVGKICRNASNSKNNNFWDFQLYSTMLKKNGFAIVPRKNLISNIGWGDIATHTKEENFRSKAEKYDFDIELTNALPINDKKINAIITYSIHTNVPKNIIDTNNLTLIRIFYILTLIKQIFVKINLVLKSLFK